VSPAPRIEAAAINVGDMPQPTYAPTAAIAHAIGIVTVAGWYRRTMITEIATSGNSASTTSVRSATVITS